MHKIALRLHMSGSFRGEMDMHFILERRGLIVDLSYIRIFAVEYAEGKIMRFREVLVLRGHFASGRYMRNHGAILRGRYL